jgi:hypothetical protein
VPQINEVAVSSASAEQFEEEVTKRFEGPSGFMLFAEIEHTLFPPLHQLLKIHIRFGR